MIDLTTLYQVSYGLYLVSVKDGEKLNGCVINTCMQITSENPIFSICLNRSNYTCELLKKAGKFSVSILSEKADPSLIGKFGFSSGREKDKFEGTAYQLIDDVPVVSDGCCAALTFDVLSVQEVETHAIILGRLTNTAEFSADTPMTYSYYHKVVKGKAPKGAPTYQEEKPAAESYVCGVCGYVYEGDLSKEPGDYTCPVCGVSKDRFVKQEAEKAPEKKKSYVCTVCGYVYEGDLTAEPEGYVCPICGVPKEKFTER